MTEDGFLHALDLWCQGRYPHPDIAPLTLDTPLLGHGILNSLQVMDLLLFLEQLRKAPLAAESIRPEAFVSPRTLYHTLMKPLQESAR